MSLTYDFDIHAIIPESVTDDPKIAKMMGDIGFDFGSQGNHMALFRSPETVAALRGADEEIRAYFEAAGFGFSVYDSGAGPGRFPAKDEAAISNTIQRLSDNMAKFELTGKNWNGFDMGAFLSHIVAMKPVEVPQAADPLVAPQHQGARAPAAAGGDPASPLERVRARHKAAQPSTEDLDDLGPTRDLPGPEVDVDPEMARRRMAMDRTYRLKRGLPLVGLGLLLFVVAIAQGRNLSIGSDLSTADATAPTGQDAAGSSIQSLQPVGEDAQN